MNPQAVCLHTGRDARESLQLRFRNKGKQEVKGKDSPPQGFVLNL
jgi:hypothetical protein